MSESIDHIAMQPIDGSSRAEILASIGFVPQSPSQSDPWPAAHIEFPTVHIDWDAISADATSNEDSDRDDEGDQTSGMRELRRAMQTLGDPSDDFDADDWRDPRDSGDPAAAAEWNDAINQYAVLSWDNAQTFAHSLEPRSIDECGQVAALIDQPSIDATDDNTRQIIQARIDAVAHPADSPLTIVSTSFFSPSSNATNPSIECTELSASIEPHNESTLLNPDEFDRTMHAEPALNMLNESVRSMLLEGHETIKQQYNKKPR